jgi:hypothetical protein
MIHVAVHPSRLKAVAEFFELFKTAWTPYCGGEPCPILLSDGAALPDASTSLFILFSADHQPGDVFPGTRMAPSDDGLDARTADGSALPVYTACRFFQTSGKPLIKDSSGRVLSYQLADHGRIFVRVGMNLFDEMTHLLSHGQPVGRAGVAALDRHIDFLRRCILDAGFSVAEVLPCPPGHPYMVCLTHDVDFVSIRSYGLGRTVQGFIQRALFGSWKRLRQGRLTWRGVFKNSAAVCSLPLIHLRLMRDFWMQFDAYRTLEAPNRSTFFLLPFKGRPGKQVTEPHASRRASRYDVEDVRAEVLPLIDAGWEMGVHGIDAWCDAACGREEKQRVESVLGHTARGIRMHWLCRNEQTEQRLDEAGFEYDSTCGYNETVGFRAGTSQVFKPLETNQLLELPMHVQDVALFYPAFMDLDDATAWGRCLTVLDECENHSGVLTILWHMRSLAPERLWGGFYQRLLERFRSDGAWIGSGEQVVEWFRRRRAVRMVERESSNGEPIVVLEEVAGVAMTVRVYHPVEFAPESEPEFTDTVRQDDVPVEWAGNAGARSAAEVV